MKKCTFFVWDEPCQRAFEEIKDYLSNPPVLAASILGKPFLIYIRAMEHSLGALLAQNDDAGHEQGIYYLSRTLQGAEQRYPMVEKECLALVFAIQKMRHYLVSQTIHVISRINPIRVFMMQPAALNWRLARWALLLSQYDIHFMSQKLVKGQAICDLMASHLLGAKTDIFEDLPDEPPEVNTTSSPEVWQMFFDSASRVGTSGSIVAGVGVVLTSPHNHVLPRAFSLTEPCTNNVVEYNALLIGLELARELGIRHLEAYGESQLIVKQMTGEYEVRNDDLIPLHQAATKLVESFESFCIEHVLRSKNTYADALSSLAANLAQPLETTQWVTVASRRLF
ncbi:uncharacterized protein LOC109835487 [Asparagus officinalis]|uniref:uncharacterized protein LOC109835487 n=1 Tax=Asparagus officinalis TaxID=4686 RepID=UPI00098E0B57|nr:uncharacterized protein LOC109835487 [Asparagus officinalis]